MKFNWAKGIVLAFVLFMIFILSFVFLVQTDKKYDNEMVLDNYYQYESQLENQKLKEHNADVLDKKLIISANENIEFVFPSDFDFTKINGKISFYRPSDQSLDFELPISLSSHHLLIPGKSLKDGRWDITVDWEYQEVSYLTKESVSLKSLK